MQRVLPKGPRTARCLHPPVLVLGWGPPDPDLVDLLQIQRDTGRASQAGRVFVPEGQCSRQDLFVLTLSLLLRLLDMADIGQNDC